MLQKLQREAAVERMEGMAAVERKAAGERKLQREEVTAGGCCRAEGGCCSLSGMQRMCQDYVKEVDDFRLAKLGSATEVYPGVTLHDAMLLQSVIDKSHDPESRARNLAILRESRGLRGKVDLDTIKEIVDFYAVSFGQPPHFAELLMQADEVAKTGIPVLRSGQEVMEFLLLRSFNRLCLTAANRETEGACKSEAVLQSFQQQHADNTDAQMSHSCWGGHLSIHDQEDYPVALTWKKQDLCLFGDEPPRYAHRCGMLFSTRRNYQNRPNCSVADLRQITDLRWIFKDARQGRSFFNGAQNYLSEALLTEEIRVPGVDRIRPGAKFFRRSIRKVDKLQSANGSGLRNDYIICVWLHSNVVCKMFVHHGHPRGVLQFAEMRRWFRLATARTEEWHQSFSSSFSPESMSPGLQKYYDRVLEARLELPDFVRSSDLDQKWAGNMLGADEVRRVKYGCDKDFKEIGAEASTPSKQQSHKRRSQKKSKGQARRRESKAAVEPEGKSQTCSHLVASDSDFMSAASDLDDEQFFSDAEPGSASAAALEEAVGEDSAMAIFREKHCEVQKGSTCASSPSAGRCVNVPPRIWRECRKCGVERPRSAYSKKVWKDCNENRTYQPTCNACKGVAPEADMDSELCLASTPTVLAARAVEEVIRSGFHSTVVEYIARSAGRVLTTAELTQMVQERQKEEGDCGICFYAYSSNHVMIFRPCCRQNMCRICDYRCHFPERPCSFCRSPCGPVSTRSCVGK